MSVRIDIDQTSLKHVQNQINLLQQNGGRSFYEAVVKVAFKIKSEAQLRLTGRGHIISSRLKNSIYVKTQKPTLRPDNQLTYSDNKGKSYKSDLGTVNVNANEVAVGTNVEYAAAIELGSRKHPINSAVKIKGVGWRYIKDHPGFKGDSYLYWAMKNVNVLQSVAKDMTDYIKFGKFLKGTNTKTGSALTNDL